MVALFRSIVTAAIAFHGLAQGERPMNIDVAPVSDPVVVDPIGEYMRTTVLNDGSILGGYVALSDTDATLQAVRSTDSGDSWEHVSTVFSGPIATKEINNACPLALGDGRILYAFRNHDKADGGGFTTYRLTVYVSEDGAATWNYLSDIDTREPQDVNDVWGLWEPFLRVAGDGAIQAYYSAENNGADQDNLMRASKDGGATWSDFYPVSGGDVESRDGMTGVADAGNGNLICVFENTEDGPYEINSVLSSDDGYTWGSRSRVYTGADGHQLGAPQVINVGGTLVVSFMSDEFGNGTPDPGADGGVMRVVTSTDGAATWSEPTSITDDIGAHWPGLHSLDDSTFLALYSFNGLGLVTHKQSS